MATKTVSQLPSRVYVPEAPIQTLGNQKITLRENPNHGQRVVNRFLGSAEGLYRVGQLGERLPKTINALLEAMGKARLSCLDTCASKSVAAWTWLTTIPRAIEMTPDVVDTVKEASASLKNSSLTVAQKRYQVEKASREVTDAAAMYGHSLGNITSLFPSMAPVGVAASRFAENVTFAHDVIGLKMSGENYLRASRVDVSRATPEIRQAIEGTKKYTLLAISKDVVSIASAVFGMVLLATGISVLPKLAFATMSLAATVFAVSRKLYEGSMPFKPINFLDHKSVTLVTA